MTYTTTTDPFPNGDPTEPNAAKPCPTCGTCPTCGRRPEASPFPYQPIPLPGIYPNTTPSPWWQIPPVWCGDALPATYGTNGIGSTLEPVNAYRGSGK